MSNGEHWGWDMSAKRYLMIAAIVAILYGIGFLLFPKNLVILYGGPPELHAVLLVQFFGSALLTWGLTVWFARHSKEWIVVRGVLIGIVVGQVSGILLTIWGMGYGLLSSTGWSSLPVYVILLGGALYFLAVGRRKFEHA